MSPNTEAYSGAYGRTHAVCTRQATNRLVSDRDHLASCIRGIQQPASTVLAKDLPPYDSGGKWLLTGVAGILLFSSSFMKWLSIVFLAADDVATMRNDDLQLRVVLATSIAMIKSLSSVVGDRRLNRTRHVVQSPRSSERGAECTCIDISKSSSRELLPSVSRP
jgi:hypothetical protein